ncbi:hypothetical protein [Geobacter argillaceus]|uniref:Uncharacterized protein n=1 Tax=Geobacter argillaceus TaxID=345631 RepID=A0A562VMU6_9BACT|nr:hypothetical protein [Geobacter argillaceus]TWJ19313.1 hypothetical protein JN12_01726 [Geobacter argillaceus]
MKNKQKTVIASILTFTSFLGFGYVEIGMSQLIRIAIYAVVIASPIMILIYKYKTTLLKTPKYLVPLGMIIGIVAFNILHKFHKNILIGFVLIVGILFVFMSCIYPDSVTANSAI